jgi:hypothetical protein
MIIRQQTGRDETRRTLAQLIKNRESVTNKWKKKGVSIIGEIKDTPECLSPSSAERLAAIIFQFPQFAAVHITTVCFEQFKPHCKI